MANPNLPTIPGYNTYVGARYVPVFYGAWLQSVSYEPLTIVEYQGNSYTSKTFVPANTPITDTTYWALTGNYNAQVEQYRQEVQAFDGRITANTNAIAELDEETVKIKKKYIFIGDSYGTFVETASQKNYIQLACAYCGLTENTDFYQFYKSGACFGTYGNLNFLQVFKDNEATIPSSFIPTDIIVLGSANDQSETYNAILTGIGSFINYVKTKYPNAKIWTSCFSKSIENDQQIKNLNFTYRAYRDAVYYGSNYIYNSEFVMTWLSRYRTDLLHPNNDGVLELAKYLALFINNGSLSVRRKFEAGNNIDFRTDGWFAQKESGSSLCFMTQNNGSIEMGFNQGTVVQAVTTREITLEDGTSIAQNNLILMDAFFYPSDNRTFVEGAMWYNDKYYKVQYNFNNNVTTNSGFRISLIFEDCNVVIPSGANVTFILPSNYQIEL